MAAALGMILGAGASYLGTQARQKRQDEHEANQHFLQTIDDHLKAHPEDAATPEFAKYGKKIYGEHWEPMQQILGFAAQAKQKEDAQFQQIAAPQKMPQTMEEWQNYRNQLIQGRSHFTDPNHIKAIEDEVASAEKAIEQMRSQQGAESRQKTTLANQQQMLKERLAGEKELLGARGAQEKSLIGAREGASLDLAREKKKEGLTGAADKADKPAKPIPESVERGRRTLTVDRLNKEFDSLHPYASKNPFGGDYETKRDEFVKQRLGGVSPTDYVNASASAAAAVPSDVSNYADKYFPKK